jgi:hypothetical protein
MAKQVQLRRGTTSQHGSFTGAVGELTVDTDKDTGVIHDGSTAGGRALAREDLNNVSAINATKIADGSVTSTEFQYISTLSSNAQTQLDAKAVLTSAQEFTAQQNFNNTTLTFDAPSQMVDGAFYSLIIIQDGTGSRTASWNTVFKWAAGTAPTLTTTAAAKDIFVWRSDGTNMYEVGRQLNVS